MKMFGKWEELVEIFFRYGAFKNTLQPGTPSADVVTVLPSAGGTLATLAGSEALTGKTIDGDTNTIQDLGLGSIKTVLGDANKVLVRDASGVVNSAALVNANVSASAAIVYSKLSMANSILDADINTAAAILRTKLANGTPDHVLINSGGGIMTSEATLAKSRGGSGQDNTSLTFPASGTLATLAGGEVLTNKTLTSPTINTPQVDVMTVDGQASAPSNPSAGFYKTYVSDSDGKLHVRDSSGNDSAVGSGSSGRNYLGEWFDGIKTIGTVTNSITATGNITISTTAWQASDTGKLTIANLASGGLRETKSLKLDHISTGAAFVQSPNFILDTVDLGKPVTVSFDVGTVALSDDYQVVLVRYNSSGTYQEQIVVAGTASATTPFSARIPAGSVTNFQGFFIANSTATDYYALRFVRNSASDTTDVTIDSIYCGPQQVIQGAAVTDWVSYTPTGSWSTNTTYSAKYRQVGDSIEIQGLITLAGAPTSADLYVNLPTGLLVDTSKLTAGSGGDYPILGSAEIFDSGAIRYVGAVVYGSTSAVYILHSTSANNGIINATSPVTFANNDRISFNFKAPISTWSSSVTMANRSVEEYSSDDGSADAFGINGSLVPNQTATTGATARTFAFQTPPQKTDFFICEVMDSSTGNWQPSTQIYPFSSGNNAGSTNNYGIRTYWSSATTYTVEFGNQGTKVAASNANAGSDPWSTLYTSGVRFRVRKVSGGASVGFPVSARNIVGDVSGTAVPSGYIGEVISRNAGTGVNAGSTGAYSNVLGAGVYITLTPGIWSLQAHFNIYTEAATTITAGNNQILIISTNETADSSGIDSNNGSDRDVLETSTTRTPGSGVSIMSLRVSNLIVNISASTNYYAKGAVQYGSTAPKWYGKLQAVRIA